MALLIDGNVYVSKAKAAPKPAASTTKSWERAYGAADAGSFGVTPKKTEPSTTPVVAYTADTTSRDTPVKGQDPTRPVSVFNPPASTPPDNTAATPFVPNALGSGNFIYDGLNIEAPSDIPSQPSQTERTADEVAKDYFGPTERAVNKSRALEIINRDFADFDGALKGETDGFIGQDDFATILTGSDYTDEQKAAAAYFYANPGQFGALERAENARAPADGLIGSGDVDAARAYEEAKRIDRSSNGVQPNVDISDRRLYAKASEHADDPSILERFDAMHAGVNENEVVDVLGRDFEVFSGPDGDGISRDNLRDIVLDDTGTYSDEHRAVAAHLLANSDVLRPLDGNFDDIIGDKNITDAGGTIGPNMKETIDTRRDKIRELESQGLVSSEEASQAISALDAAQATLTPAEFSRVSQGLGYAALGGQSLIALQSALSGDYDEAIETTVDAAVPFALKQILTKIAPGTAGGPVGLAVSAVSLFLAFTPLDSSATRQLSYSELSGEINESGQRVYPGGYGTQINGNGFAPDRG